MRIKFECFGRIRNIVGKKDVFLDFSEQIDLLQAIREFAKNFSSELEGLLFNNGRFSSFFAVHLDGKNIDIAKLHKTKLSDG